PPARVQTHNNPLPAPVAHLLRSSYSQQDYFARLRMTGAFTASQRRRDVPPPYDVSKSRLSRRDDEVLGRGARTRGGNRLTCRDGRLRDVYAMGQPFPRRSNDEGELSREGRRV